jgi:8-oxo-dGTP diphosphatase
MIKNNAGRQFLDFIPVKENEIERYHPIAGSFAIIHKDDSYLLCYNVYRNQWELPAGKRELGETYEECAIRELYEETGQNLDSMEFKGLIKMKNVKGSIQYNPVYYRKVEEIQPFIENNETNDIMLWNQEIELNEYDDIDLHLIKRYSFL